MCTVTVPIAPLQLSFVAFLTVFIYTSIVYELTYYGFKRPFDECSAYWASS